MKLPRKQKVYKPRKVKSMDTFRSLFRFHDENVAWMSEYFLCDNTGTRGGALSNKQRMEVLLRHVGDPGFQNLVEEKIWESIRVLSLEHLLP